MESKKDQTTMTDQYLRDIILNFMIAGKDSSANTLSWFFYMLCKNPLVEEKIAQEVKDFTSSHESEPNIDEFVANLTDATLDKMHYLHAALTETLRLYPAVPTVPFLNVLKPILNYLFLATLQKEKKIVVGCYNPHNMLLIEFVLMIVAHKAIFIYSPKVEYI